MSEDIEALVLSGKFFERPDSPERSTSPDSGWHDEELKHSLQDDEEQQTSRPGHAPIKESIGMGPGRTGVKGVIRDRNEALSRERERQKREIEELNRKLDKQHLGGKTYLEEEREKALDPLYDGKIDELVLKEQERKRELQDEKRDIFGYRKERRFGHLREVGIEGFVTSVEEERGICVVVHIYDPSLERCEDLDNTLLRLARLCPEVKFIRARASALGFATSTLSPSAHNSNREVTYGRYLNNSYYEKDESDSDYDDDRDGENEVDFDMLPTLLVYRDGELVHNWVRVDWEAGPAGVEYLLERHQITPRRRVPNENLGLPPDGSDDELDEDLQWSDSDAI
ncbi:hypothetical protein M378DRAFT_167142 [Amanita muscaria Koide BX008]|uniref:Phosducin domain-containing protein n=1 Tax=Amanita muscaria (strain Koide BX008) TaxID=946122 RepID=A0A0C2WY49_AMAMK|nr:hypothetical protein M378DRAFT_167142 [Amanita muscaria Koide BX008]